MEDKRIYNCLEITDLKDMLKKTGDMYGEKNAYKIKKNGTYITFTHKQVREMIDALRNIINKLRIKR